MTDIEQKALALVNEVRKERGFEPDRYLDREVVLVEEALCRAIEQHEAFRREVSDAVEAYNDLWRKRTPGRDEFMGHFIRFIIAKPDPLVEVMNEMGFGWSKTASEEFRAALAARNLKIVETPNG